MTGLFVSQVVSELPVSLDGVVQEIRYSDVVVAKIVLPSQSLRVWIFGEGWNM